MISDDIKYKYAEQDREILQLLAQGEREIEAEAGHDLKSILAEADRLLSEEPL